MKINLTENIGTAVYWLRLAYNNLKQKYDAIPFGSICEHLDLVDTMNYTYMALAELEELMPELGISEQEVGP